MIDVVFPDGSRRGVAGQLCRLPSDAVTWPEIRFRQVPINCDPIWKYVSQDNVWIAVPRQSPDVAILKPKTNVWWDGITQMRSRSEQDGDQAEAA